MKKRFAGSVSGRVFLLHFLLLTRDSTALRSASRPETALLPSGMFTSRASGLQAKRDTFPVLG